MGRIIESRRVFTYRDKKVIDRVTLRETLAVTLSISIKCLSGYSVISRESHYHNSIIVHTARASVPACRVYRAILSFSLLFPDPLCAVRVFECDPTNFSSGRSYG